MATGKLKIHVFEAVIKEDGCEAKNSKVNPYYSVSILDQYRVALHKPKPFRSKAIKGQTNPKWVDPAYEIDLPCPKAEFIMIELFDKKLLGRDRELGSVTISISKVASDSRNFFEAVRVYANIPGDAPNRPEAVEISGPNSFKVRISFVGAEAEAAEAAQVQSYLQAAHAVKSKLSMSRIKVAADKFLKTTKAEEGFSITSKKQLEEFLEEIHLADDVMNFDEFILGQGLSASPKTSSSPNWKHQRAEILWTLCDIDNDGKIVFPELMMFFALRSDASVQEKADFSFELLDTDKNGTLSREEMLKVQQLYATSCMIGSMQKYMSEAKRSSPLGDHLKRLGEARLKKLILAQFEQANISERLTEHIMSLADTDGSNDVTKDEYLSFLTSEENRKAMSDVVHSIVVEIEEALENRFAKEMKGQADRRAAGSSSTK